MESFSNLKEFRKRAYCLLGNGKLMRLKSNWVLYDPPPPYCGRGRPRKHGAKFKLNAPDTWWPPQQQQDINDETLGRLRLRCWR